MIPNSPQRYPTCTREDLIRLLGASHAEVDAATDAIITAVDAGAQQGPDAALAILAQYVLDNGHVHEATDLTTGQLATLATHFQGQDADRVAHAIDTWEMAWFDYTDRHIGAPTKSDIEKAITAAREAVTDGAERDWLLQAAHHAGSTFRTDIGGFIPRTERA